MGTIDRESFNAYDIQVNGIERIGANVQLYAEAWQNGVKCGFEDGTVDVQRFVFVNPPIRTPDGTIRVYEEPSNGDITFANNYVYDTRLAIQRALEHTISVSEKDCINPSIIEGKTGNTVTTVYPDAHVESTSVDGYTTHLDATAGNTWDDIHDGAGTANGGSDDAIINAATWAYHNVGAGGWYYITRSAFLFDTSSIEDTDEISQAVFSVYGQAKGSDWVTWESEYALNVYASDPTSDTDLANSDYANVHWGTTAFSTEKTYGTFSTAGYNDYTLNASGEAAIDFTGISKFGTRTSYDASDTAPTNPGDNLYTIYTNVYSADQGGTTNDPKLVITHSAAAGSPDTGTIDSGTLAEATQLGIVYMYGLVFLILTLFVCTIIMRL